MALERRLDPSGQLARQWRYPETANAVPFSIEVKSGDKG